MYAYVFICVLYIYVHVKARRGIGSLKAGVTGVSGMPSFLHRYWDMNSNSHDLLQALLTTEPSLLALVPPYFWDFLCFSYTHF